MDEKEVIKFFLDNGYQVSKEALPLVIENPEQILTSLNIIKPRPFIVTEEHIREILGKRKAREEIKIKPLFKEERKPLNVDDSLKKLLVYYEKMKEILSKNIGLEKLISINKITERTTDFSIIAMIREKRSNSALVEDPTGEIEIYFNDLLRHKLEEIDLDDVAGIKCRRIGGKYQATHIIFPDIPVNRKINRTSKKLVIGILPAIKQQISNPPPELFSVFTFEESKEAITISEPSLIEIDKIKILAIPKKIFIGITDITSDFLLDILKKRHVLSKFVLEDIPDIVISDLGPTVSKNYKGTTIVSNTDKNRIFLIDLNTRDVEEKEL